MSADLFSRFFDDVDPMLGPFGLLGITPETCSDESVAAALKQRLATLAAHPQAWSPEADEVRLALHVAAAQLRDPAVRSVLLASWSDPSMSAGPGMMALGGGGAPRGAPAQRTARAAVEATCGHDMMFGEVALQVLVHSGGWNEDAKRRLAALAHAHGVSMSGLMQAVTEVSRRQRTTVRQRAGRLAAPTTGEQAHSEPEAMAAPPPATQRRSITIATLVLLGLTVVMLLVLVSVRGNRQTPLRTMTAKASTKQVEPSKREPPRPLEQQTAESLRPEPPIREDVKPDVALVRPREVTPPDPEAEGRRVLSQIRAARAILSSDPRTSLKEFEAGVAALGTWWVRFDHGVLTAVQDEIANYVMESARRDRGTGRAALEVVMGPAQRLVDSDRLLTAGPIHQAVWSTGMLVRLRRERGMPELLGEAIGSVLRRVESNGRMPPETTVWRGIALGLDGLGDRLQPRLTDPVDSVALEEAWRHWIVAARALAVGDAEGSRQVIARAAERLLTDGPELPLSKPADTVMKLLLGAMDWNEPRIAGMKLLEWFDDVGRVTTADLSLVTAWMLTSSGIPNVTGEMVLTAAATPTQRSEMRNAYATLLGLEQAKDPYSGGGRWLSQARDMLRLGTPTDPAEALLRAAAMAKLNESAAHRWRRDESASDRAREDAQLSRLENQARSATPSGAPMDPGKLTSPGDDRDGQWAKRYLAAMNSADQRVELLNELRNTRGPFGPADADVLAEAACFGSPMQVRRLAQSIVREQSDNLLVVNGLLEALPRAARQPAVSEMIRSVTGVRMPTTEDPAWRVIARRAVVDRLIAMIATARDRQLDHYATVIDDAYRARVAAFGPPVSSRRSETGVNAPGPLGRGADADFRDGPGTGDAAPEQVAGMLWDVWAGAARRYAEGQWTFATFDELQRRRTGRSSLAEGPIQLFAAEQASAAEIMAYVVAAERQTRALHIARVLDQMNSERRQAPHVFAQIEAAERAMLHLWMVRLGEESQP